MFFWHPDLKSSGFFCRYISRCDKVISIVWTYQRGNDLIYICRTKFNNTSLSKHINTYSLDKRIRYLSSNGWDYSSYKFKRSFLLLRLSLSVIWQKIKPKSVGFITCTPMLWPGTVSGILVMGSAVHLLDCFNLLYKHHSWTFLIKLYCTQMSAQKICFQWTILAQPDRFRLSRIIYFNAKSRRKVIFFSFGMVLLSFALVFSELTAWQISGQNISPRYRPKEYLLDVNQGKDGIHKLL